jgi:hypothetical protein
VKSHFEDEERLQGRRETSEKNSFADEERLRRNSFEDEERVQEQRETLRTF